MKPESSSQAKSALLSGVSRASDEVVRVREDGVDHLLRIALLAQDRRAVLRVLVERGVDLVVEVVEQRGDAPELLVLAELRAYEAVDASTASAWRSSASLFV